MKIRNCFFVIISFLLLIQCKEVKDWSDETDTIPPGSISNPNVTNINGGAIITYTLPTDKDLLGVKAIYSLTEESEKKEAFASAFSDTLILEGFSDTKSRKVQLVSVDKSKNESQPVEVTIQPLTPPVEIIRNSLTVNETFGGIFVTWENPDRKSIGISLYAEDSTGFMNLDYTYFTTERDGRYSFRGYESLPKKFRIHVRDKWNNLSSPLDTILTPIFEEDVILRNQSGNLLWQRYGYANRLVEWMGDYAGQYSSCVFERFFDGGTSSSNYFHPGLSAPNYLTVYTQNPEHAQWNTEYRTFYLTIDMVEEVRLSRYKLYGRTTSLNPNDLIEARIWATNEEPKQPEDFNFDRIKSLQYWTNWSRIEATDAWKNDWVNIGYFHVIPPSGALENFQWTAEDRVWWQSGVDFDFFPEHTKKPFRYMRIECIRNIKGEGNMTHQFIEMEVYGSFVNK